MATNWYKKAAERYMQVIIISRFIWRQSTDCGKWNEEVLKQNWAVSQHSNKSTKWPAVQQI